MSGAEHVASMSPDELIAVITRGLEADERAAKAWLPFGNPDAAARAHAARHNPGRVLADVESKRETIRLYRDTLATIETFEHRGLAAKGYEVAAESYLNVLWALARPYLGQERA